MNTLGTNPSVKVSKEESYAIAHSFSCDAIVKKGQLVKLKSNGDVTPVTAATDIPVGVVVVGNAAVDTDVTVQTIFSAIMTALADGTVDEGNTLACTGHTTNVPKFAVGVTTSVISAIALTGATTGLAITVGVLRTPYLMTVAA